jgi:hypothetical protein
MKIVLVAVTAILAGTSACGPLCPYRMGGDCLDDEEADSNDDDDDDVGTVQCESTDTDHGLEGECDFSVTGCDDGSTYAIVCATSTSCECIENLANGDRVTAEFTIESSCQTFTTSDKTRFQAFAQANCGWSLSYPEGF